MKKIDGYWCDDWNNRWNCSETTKEQAIMYSQSLINCRDCYDCYRCSDCKDCENCYDCSHCWDCCNCHGCENCRDCNDCRECNSCRACRDCNNCSNCRCCCYCHDCRNCDNCNDCSYCHNYEIRPKQYVASGLGPREESAIFYYNGRTLQVVCGSFRGNLKEFEKYVSNAHADSEKYKKQYLREIEKVKQLFDLKGKSV